ncbi:MAG: hypothetical protein JW940_32740 [Polyangiaceae bacterium]|nr:hypothetical protein [Polyangiaceae bacterium]
MKEATTLTRAKLTELWPAPSNKLVAQGRNGGAAKVVTVQFNPQTLKVTFSNQNAGGDQPKGSPVQFVGKGATKLAVELVFDVSRPLPQGSGEAPRDVRELTQQIAYFMTPELKSVEGQTQQGLVPPGVRLQWGTFLFEGVMDSMDETLDLFSSDGRPLRASVAISLSKQEIQFQFDAAGSKATPGAGASPGTRPLHTPRAGETLPAALQNAGRPAWQQTARALGIESIRHLPPGVPLDLLRG